MLLHACGSAVLRYVVNVPSVVLRHFHRMFHMDAFYGSAFFFKVIRMAGNVIFDVNLRPTEKYMPL